MRATSIRRLAGGAAALLLTGATLLSATGAALAAVPLATATNVALPTQFSAGNNVGFRGTFLFRDGSTLAKLYLRIRTTGADHAVYWSATRGTATEASLVANACTPAILPGAAGVDVLCTFKTVRFEEQFVVTAAYAPVAGATSVTALFEWSTTGSTGSDGGDTSHGDTWTDDDGPAVSTLFVGEDSADFAGGFSIVASGGIGNVQSVSSSNRQATRLAGLPAGTAATVLDGLNAGGSCGTYVCTTEFEWSEINVGDGDTPFTAYITYYQGSPQYFIHDFLTPAGATQEPVNPCPKSKTPAEFAPCFTWSPKLKQATIYALHNGSWKGN